MFHWKDDLYFGRKADGSVRIIKLPPGPSAAWPRVEWPLPNAVLDVMIPAAEWCSIITSVSGRGETSDAYMQAQAFHINVAKETVGAHTVAEGTKCWKCQRLAIGSFQCSQSPCGLFRRESDCSEEEKKLGPFLTGAGSSYRHQV